MGVKKEQPTLGRRTLKSLMRGGRAAKAASARTGKHMRLFRDPRIRTRAFGAAEPETRRAQDEDTLRGLPVRVPGPIQFAGKLAGFWGLSQEDLAGLLGFGPEDTAHAAALLTGRAEVHGRDVRDRIAHLFRIRESLHSLFRDLEVENEWLREPHELLEGKSPMSLMVGGSMEDLLLVREYVDEVAGS